MSEENVAISKALSQKGEEPILRTFTAMTITRDFYIIITQLDVLKIEH